MSRTPALARLVLGYGTALVAAAALALWAGFAATGHDRRGYVALGAESQVSVGADTMSPAEIAGRYRPVIDTVAGRPSPPLEKTFYEVVDDGDQVTLLYHEVWADEVHPNPIVNAGYWLYRGAVYCFPPRDVERVAVTVAKADGSIASVLFEGPNGQTYDAPQQPHAAYSLTRRPDGRYDFEIDGEAASEKELPVVDGTRVRLVNASWNHLSDLAAADSVGQPPPEGSEVPLEELTDDLYADGKYARKRPAGGFTTEENATDRWVASGLAFLALAGGVAAWPAARGFAASEGLGRQRRPSL